MTQQQNFGRKWRVRIDDIETTELDVRFSVKRTVRREANTAELIIYNLSRDQIEQIRHAGRAQVEIHAGLGDREPTLIFLGQIVRNGLSASNTDTENIVSVRARDGGALGRMRSSRSWRSGTGLNAIAQSLAEDLGVGTGNLSEHTLTLPNGRSTTVGPMVLQGTALEAFDRTMRATGMSWSVQNGNLVIRPLVRTSIVEALVLSADTNLVGSPSQEERHKVACECLMIAGVEPGQLVRLESRFITGTYEIEECEYRGESAGKAWTIKCLLRPPRTQQ
jgi:hypothetical protein